MGTGKRQQVVFIARTLWGGGVEKVLYELVHAIDRERFDVYVVYMLEEENPIPYDVSIPLICVQPAAGTKGMAISISKPSAPFRHKAFHTLRSLYRMIIPSFIRDGDRLRVWIERFQSRVFGFQAVASGSNSISGQGYTIRTAIDEMWVQALQLKSKLDVFDAAAVYIPLEEVNTVLLWLALTKRAHILASHHVPYSWAQRFRYPDTAVRDARQWLYLNACRAADVVAFPSEAARIDLYKNFGIPLEKTVFLPNPINGEAVIEKSREPLDINLEKYQGKTIFTQVARLSLEKSPFLLVDACSLLRKQYEDFVVLFVGGGVLRDEMQERIKRAGLENHILLLGEKTNPYPYMAASRATLLTSTTEGFGLVLVEAMLCGSLPVSTDCGGPRDIIGDNQYGLLVTPDDARAFADAMYRIAVDDGLCERLRGSARERAGRFDTAHVVKEWENLILRIEGENPKG